MKVLLHPLRSARMALLFLLLLVMAGSGGLGCAEAPASPDRHAAQALRRSFPDQAGAVLAPPGEAFVATAEGFALETTAAPSRMGRDVMLPLTINRCQSRLLSEAATPFAVQDRVARWRGGRRARRVG